MAEETPKELEDIRAEMNRLSVKINRRMKELEGMSEGYVVMYHGDPIIDTAARKLRMLRNKARRVCALLNLVDGVYKEFKHEPKMSSMIRITKDLTC